MENIKIYDFVYVCCSRTMFGMDRDSNDTGWHVTHIGTVYPWEADHMAHMNVRFYVARFDEATWNLFAAIGITPSYLRDSNSGMVAVKQETTYRRELLPGDVLTIRSRLLDVGDKSLRFEHEMLNRETDELAAVTVLTGIHIDRERRKAIPLPDAVVERARAALEA